MTITALRTEGRISYTGAKISLSVNMLIVILRVTSKKITKNKVKEMTRE